MELVRAGLVDDVQDAAEAAAVLRRVVRAEDLEFLDGVNGREHGDAGEPVDGGEGRRHTVDHRVHHGRARPVHAVAHRVVVVADGAGDARCQEDQGVHVARVQRQLEDPTVVYELAHRAAVRFEQRRVRPDFDRIRQLPHLQREVDHDGRGDLHRGPCAHRTPEAVDAGLDAVLARRQGDRRVAPFDIRRGGLPSVGLFVDDGDRGAGNHRAARVLERADDGPGERLSEGDGRADDERERQVEQS